MLESTRKTGRLVLVRDLMTAKLEFSEGVIVGVRSTAADHSPAKTLMIVAGWNEGTFELTSIAPPPCPVGGAPRLSVTKLLLAHTLLQDVTAYRQPKPASTKEPAVGRGDAGFVVRNPHIGN